MKLVLFLLALSLSSSGCVPEHSYCCKSGQVLVDFENLCVDINNHTIDTKSKLACDNVDLIDDIVLNYTIAPDGRMIIFIPDNKEQHVEGEHFCLANQTLDSDDKVIMLCGDAEVQKLIDDKVLAYLLCVSVVFLCITFLIYCALPELRDLQGKSIINFCGSLAIGLSILSSLKLRIGISHLPICATKGFLSYFFLIASFFWMNAISIQILLTIRRPSKFYYGWKEFIWYALYAWGCPAILTISFVIVNSLPGHHRKPGIGLNTCWFFSLRSEWYYMYSIMTILILANICIFVYISIHLCRHTFASSHVKALRYKFNMTLRMFVVMGVPWVFEMISSLAGPHVAWTISDMLNMFQGIFIFLLLVVFRKRTIKAMHKRGWLNCMSGYIERRLAVGEDDEEEVVHQTVDIALRDETKE